MLKSSETQIQNLVQSPKYIASGMTDGSH